MLGIFGFGNVSECWQCYLVYLSILGHGMSSEFSEMYLDNIISKM